MNSKEKAKELFDKFYEPAAQHNFSEAHGWELDRKQTKINAKQCAMICVDEIKQVVKEIEPSIHDWKHHYWHEVKTEIKKL